MDVEENCIVWSSIHYIQIRDRVMDGARSMHDRYLNVKFF
jgi:hypothetical protein